MCIEYNCCIMQIFIFCGCNFASFSYCMLVLGYKFFDGMNKSTFGHNLYTTCIGGNESYREMERKILPKNNMFWNMNKYGATQIRLLNLIIYTVVRKRAWCAFCIVHCVCAQEKCQFYLFDIISKQIACKYTPEVHATLVIKCARCNCALYTVLSFSSAVRCPAHKLHSERAFFRLRSFRSALYTLYDSQNAVIRHFGYSV